MGILLALVVAVIAPELWPGLEENKGKMRALLVGAVAFCWVGAVWR